MTNPLPKKPGLSLDPALAARLRDSGYRVLVTGASGWLGRASLEILQGSFGDSFAARVACFGSAARILRLSEGLAIAQRPLDSIAALDSRPSLLLHFAFLTREKTAAMSLQDYIEANHAIADRVRQALGPTGVERVFLVSSGAVYQPADPYGELKREDEEWFAGWAMPADPAADHPSRSGAREDARRVLTARLFNLSGPHINKSYALASFIDQARHPDARVVIHATHPVIRSYVAVGNLIQIALAHLLADATEPYVVVDTAGDEEVEMQELAPRVIAVVNPAATLSRPRFDPAPVDRYVGDGTLFRSLAERYGVSLDDLDTQIRDTADFMACRMHVHQP